MEQWDPSGVRVKHRASYGVAMRPRGGGGLGAEFPAPLGARVVHGVRMSSSMPLAER
mgnify:CR=1 FL=1